MNGPIYTDVLIIGSGLAGLLTAIELTEKGASVVLATKGPLLASNSTYAQGGLAAVIPSHLDDSVNHHLQDTLKSGAGLTDARVAERIVSSGQELIDRLTALGVIFDRENGSFQLAREGGHSHARVLHNKDATGRSITTGLIEALKPFIEAGRLHVLEHVQATRLLLSGSAAVGAEFIDVNTNQPISIRAATTVLATGGAGQVFARTTNPKVATADGIALAFRAGAALSDLEFYQFHPTALCLPGAPPFLISEAVRGEGAILLDGNGERFMPSFHPDAELATRDVVSRAIHSTMISQNIPNVWLDFKPIGDDNLATRFPQIVAALSKHNIDPQRQPVPVCPAAHYYMGGIEATVEGKTSITGLYAIGECASTGLHGANRLASNSLLEAGVMAMRAAADIASISNRIMPPHMEELAPSLIPHDINAVKSAMYRNAGLVRDANGLSTLIANLTTDCYEGIPSTAEEVTAANILLAGRLIATAALSRQESRGAHLRSDFSQRDDLKYGCRLSVDSDGWRWSKPAQQAAVRAPQNVATAID